MTIRTGRLIIRPIMKEDWKAVKAIWEDFHQTRTEKVSFYKDIRGNDIIFDGGIFTLGL